jgi:hypothetical protein
MPRGEIHMEETTDPRLLWLAHPEPPPRAEAAQMANLASGAAVSGVVVARLAGTLAVRGAIQSVNASSLIFGPDAPQALARDRAVVAARASGFDALVLALRMSPLTGCTSVMDIALTRSGWNPLDPRQTGNHDAFARYAAMLTDTPFFDRPPTLSHNGLNLLGYRDPQSMVRAIAALLPGTTPQEQQRVSDSILDMTHNVFGGGGGDARATLFVQQALAVNANLIAVNLYWCQVMMHYERHSNKGSVSVDMQSIFDVERVALNFPVANWAQYAEAVARQKVTDVETWLQQTAAPH